MSAIATNFKYSRVEDILSVQCLNLNLINKQWIQNYPPKLRGNQVISSQGFFCCEGKKSFYSHKKHMGIEVLQLSRKKTKLNIVVLGSAEIRLSPGTSTAEVYQRRSLCMPGTILQWLSAICFFLCYHNQFSVSMSWFCTSQTYLAQCSLQISILLSAVLT